MTATNLAVVMRRCPPVWESHFLAHCSQLHLVAQTYPGLHATRHARFLTRPHPSTPVPSKTSAAESSPSQCVNAPRMPPPAQSRGGVVAFTLEFRPLADPGGRVAILPPTSPANNPPDIRNIHRHAHDGHRMAPTTAMVTSNMENACISPLLSMLNYAMQESMHPTRTPSMITGKQFASGEAVAPAVPRLPISRQVFFLANN